MAHSEDTGRPNILVIMSDEHGGMFSSVDGHPFIETPSMERLAAQGVTFDNAYCNAPLCVPSRISFMTGKFVSKARGWDNATPLGCDAMTWPYLLRSRGYSASLDGKMHLIGPAPLHGFSGQLTREPHEKDKHFVHRWRIDGIPEATERWPEVPAAGPGTSWLIEFDDEVEAAALAYLKDRARAEQPFALCVGFLAPHFPLIVPEPYFSMYYPERTDLPDLPPGHLENLPPAARRLRRMFGLGGPYTDDELMRARAAYYGMVTYLDAKIGRILDALEEHNLAGNTLVIHTSDHGEMLGEHGLWRKMNFYEQAARVPLQMRWPGVFPKGTRIPEVVSLVDVVATMLEASGVPTDRWHLDGDSLLPLIRGDEASWKDEAFAEHLAHGTDRARAMIRSGNWKLCYGHGDPPELELYDLQADPGEFNNLADRAEVMEVQERLLVRIRLEWPDPDALTREIHISQEERWEIRERTTDEMVF